MSINSSIASPEGSTSSKIPQEAFTARINGKQRMCWPSLAEAVSATCCWEEDAEHTESMSTFRCCCGADRMMTTSDSLSAEDRTNGLAVWTRMRRSEAFMRGSFIRKCSVANWKASSPRMMRRTWATFMMIGAALMCVS